MQTHDLGTFIHSLNIHFSILQMRQNKTKTRSPRNVPKVAEVNTAVKSGFQPRSSAQAPLLALHNPAWAVLSPSAKSSSITPGGTLPHLAPQRRSTARERQRPRGHHPRPAGSGLSPGGRRGTLAILLVISAVSTAKSCS